MTIDQFFGWVARRWAGRKDDKSLAIKTLGLCGEAGEVSEPIKKYLRGSGPVDVSALRLELGDVLHYWCAIADHYGISLESVVNANVEKLQHREDLKRLKSGFGQSGCLTTTPVSEQREWL